METLHPGVYIQEVSSGVRPIEGASTSTAAFVGVTEKGPVDRALMVTSYTEYERIYGSFVSGYLLAQSALQFFNNGGRRLYIARVATNPVAASVSLRDRQTASPPTDTAAVTITANSPGKWGNKLLVDVSDATQSANEFKLVIKEERSANPLVTAILENYDGLSMDPDAPNFVENVVNPKSKYVQVKVNRNNVSGASGFSRSEEGAATTFVAATTSPPAAAEDRVMLLNVDGDGARMITLSGTLATGAAMAQAIQAAVRALDPPQRTSTGASAYSSFTASFDPVKSVYTLTSGTVGSNSYVEVIDAPASNAAGLLKLGKTRGVEQTGGAALRPGSGADIRVGESKVGGNIVAPISQGSDGATPQPIDYQKGFTLLDPLQDVNIVAAPGIGSEAMVDFGANYCAQRGDCFFVGDMYDMCETKEDAQKFVNSLTVKSSYAAVYFPWLWANDPSGASSAPVMLPPSGYVAGMYSRIDAKRGVWKAPAGTEANLGGAVGLLADISDADQDTLNPIGANVIRAFPASGIVIWGARTLATRSDPEYRYVPVRRTAIFLEQSIYNGIQWAVFEPNDESLWASLRLNIGAFMMLQFRAGAFQGKSASDAFFVQCDSKTNTQADIDAGIVNILVGFAPLKPAEFVILRLSQKTGQPTG
jgi:phage tail sheath protein FI